MKPASHHCHCLKGHLLLVTHKKNWGQGFILLLPQAAVLPGSDAGSDGAASLFTNFISICLMSNFELIVRVKIKF